jgi:hypothetical protein
MQVIKAGAAEVCGERSLRWSRDTEPGRLVSVCIWVRKLLAGTNTRAKVAIATPPKTLCPPGFYTNAGRIHVPI